MWIITFDCDIYFKTYRSEIPKVIWPSLFFRKKIPSAFWKLRYFKSKQTKIAFLIKCLRLLVIDSFISTPTPFAGSLQHSHEAVQSTLEGTVAQTTHSFFFSAASHMPPCGTPQFSNGATGENHANKGHDIRRGGTSYKASWQGNKFFRIKKAEKH